MFTLMLLFGYYFPNNVYAKMYYDFYYFNLTIYFPKKKKIMITINYDLFYLSIVFTIENCINHLYHHRSSKLKFVLKTKY